MNDFRKYRRIVEAVGRTPNVGDKICMVLMDGHAPKIVKGGVAQYNFSAGTIKRVFSNAVHFDPGTGSAVRRVSINELGYQEDLNVWVTTDLGSSPTTS